MFGQVSLAAVFFAFAAGLQLQGSQHENSLVSNGCYDGDKLFFVHVMKDGGTSFDDWVVCLGDILKFSVKYDQGPVDQVRGDLSCSPPSVCTAHRNLADAATVCENGGFEDAKTFTILREPTSYAFSLFNYYKYQLKEEWMEKYPNFGDLLKHLSNTSLTNQFDNTMVTGYFSPNALTLSYAYGERAESLIRSNYVATREDLENAKKMMEKVNAIFFTERLTTFVDDYKQSGLPFAESADLCEFGESNKADCEKDGCATEATDEEVKMATELNQFDIELYEWAKTLPQALGSDE